MTDEEFDRLIQRALDELPAEYVKSLDNVAITYADDRDSGAAGSQPRKLPSVTTGFIRRNIQTSRYASSYSGVLPDRITIFKNPIRYVTHDDASFFEQIKRTVWHEIAHHYGLGHDRIHVIERNHGGG